MTGLRTPRILFAAGLAVALGAAALVASVLMAPTTSYGVAAAPAAAAPATAATASAPALQEFRFHHDDILGSSLELTVVCRDKAQAEAAEKAVLTEVERLRMILSTYDPTSEVSRAVAATAPMKASPELIEVLDTCEQWRVRSGGAFNAQLGDLIALWAAAAKAGKLPDDATLADLARRAAKPMWQIDKAAGTALRVEALKPNLDAMAKGYILEKAAQAAKAKDPALAGLLVAIGGDMRLLGAPVAGAGQPWLIGVADPKRAQDNALPLTRVRLTDAGVASSGHYEHFYSIGGKKYSHIFDPRTGRPVEGSLGATAVARDTATADALATILCVLTPAEGLALVKTVPGAQCLILGADGKLYPSDGWKALEVAAPAAVASTPAAATPAAPAVKGGAWPAGNQAIITLNLTARGKRPYVVVWIEDAAGKPVRTLALWGNEAKYDKKLSAWWTGAAPSAPNLAAVTRATRPAGRYTLAWDGLDDRGKPVAQGTYAIRVETAQEEGPHTSLKGTIVCGAAAATSTLEGTSAHIGEATVAYGPPAK
jgi:thiamine biosynthesis lipoprotein ApbE